MIAIGAFQWLIQQRPWLKRVAGARAKDVTLFARHERRSVGDGDCGDRLAQRLFHTLKLSVAVACGARFGADP